MKLTTCLHQFFSNYLPHIKGVSRHTIKAYRDAFTLFIPFAANRLKIKTGSLYDVAEVFRDLSLLKLTKDLSFGERKLFDTAQVLLVRELSTAKKTDEETIISELDSLFVSDSLEN